MKKRGLNSGSMPLIARFARDQRGATAIEYGLIVALVFLGAAAAIRAYTVQSGQMYSTIQSDLDV